MPDEQNNQQQTTPATPSTPQPIATPSTPASPSAAGTPAPGTETDSKGDSKAGAKAEGSLLNQEDAGKPEGAPEKYEAFKAPEGFELDAAAIEKASPIFKELGLSQGQAQKLVDFYSELSKQAAEAPMELWKTTREGWLNEIKADPEIGSKLSQVRTTVARALDSLGDPALAKSFREAMDITGAGDNPAFVRTFYKLAQKLVEGGPTAPGNPGSAKGPESLAKAMYPNLA